MEGVLPHILIGVVLFTPIGVFAGWYQQKKAAQREADRKLMEERMNG
jgi:hypothetical protein